MLGHILRSPENTPAAYPLCTLSKAQLLRSGSHKANLLKVLRDDMKSMPIDRTSEYAALRQRAKANTEKAQSFEDFRLLAHNKSLWRDIPKFQLAHIRI